ncbi:hypothetical protein, partial [Catenovulum agarivorans]|uniref:hypothetical protein n=1 Tax=Catenovulum agarivorans TaxID=1172192 RepID=UPI00047488F3
TPANMPFNTAVQFMLVKQVVQKHLPESILLPLQNYFSVAETVLKQASDKKTKLNAYSGEQQKEAMLLLALVKQTKIELTLNLTIDKNNADKQVTYPNAEVWQVDYQQQAVQYYIRLSHLGTKLHWLSLNDIVNITATNLAASHDKTTLTQIEVELVCTGAIERISDYLQYHQIPVTTEIKQGSIILATFNNFQQIWQLVIFAMGKVQLITPNWVCRRVRANLNSLSCCLIE